MFSTAALQLCQIMQVDDKDPKWYLVLLRSSSTLDKNEIL